MKPVKASKAVKAVKAAAKPAKRKLLSHADRSASARLAALKAHCHPSFAKTRTQSLAQAKANFATALRKAPAALRARFAA